MSNIPTNIKIKTIYAEKSYANNACCVQLVQLDESGTPVYIPSPSGAIAFGEDFTQATDRLSKYLGEYINALQTFRNEILETAEVYESENIIREDG